MASSPMICLNIYRRLVQKRDGSSSVWYDLLCTTDFVDKNYIAGSPTKRLEVSEYVLLKAFDMDPSSANNLNKFMLDELVKKCESAIGKKVYTIFNENGYLNYLRFFDVDVDAAKS